MTQPHLELALRQPQWFKKVRRLLDEARLVIARGGGTRGVGTPSAHIPKINNPEIEKPRS
jgi:hypothetical protein